MKTPKFFSSNSIQIFAKKQWNSIVWSQFLDFQTVDQILDDIDKNNNWCDQEFYQKFDILHLSLLLPQGLLAEREQVKNLHSWEITSPFSKEK